jgi:hypothetical protein
MLPPWHVTSQVRRHRESGVQRLLGEVVADALAAEGVAPEEIRWDSGATRTPLDGPGELAEQRRAATRRLRFRSARSLLDGEGCGAKKLIGERRPRRSVPEPQSDAEPTVDLHDELAIVRGCSRQR